MLRSRSSVMYKVTFRQVAALRWYQLGEKHNTLINQSTSRYTMPEKARECPIPVVRPVRLAMHCYRQPEQPRAEMFLGSR